MFKEQIHLAIITEILTKEAVTFEWLCDSNLTFGYVTVILQEDIGLSIKSNAEY